MPIHETTLSEFIGDFPIIAEKNHEPHHQRIVKISRELLKYSWLSIQSPRSRDYGKLLRSDRSPPGYDLLVLIRRPLSRIYVIHLDSGACVGGIAEGTPYIVSKHRGLGLGKTMVRAAFDYPAARFLDPSSYSEQGYAARCAAHRDAVLEAVARGDAVTQDSLERYAALLANRKTAGKGRCQIDGSGKSE